MEIREATRKNVKLLIGLAGVSGSGKTYSALQLAYGLTNKISKKVGFLDTENGRGSLYADIFGDNKFLIGDMLPPFAPEKYTESIKQFEKAGVEVIVIDSFSHAWEGEGGCKDIADEALKQGKKVANWIKAKAEWKKMLNSLLLANCHVIVCMRARPKVRVETVKGELTYIDEGLQMITEKNAPFEMTASLMLHDSGKYQDVLKCPAELVEILGRGKGYITVEDGLALRKWIEGGGSIDDELAKARTTLKLAAEGGITSLKTAWSKLPKSVRDKMGGSCPEEFKKVAVQFE